MKRRAALGLIAAGLLAGCGGVIDYADRGPANLALNLTAQESGIWAQRAVHLDVWAGAKGAQEYLGSATFGERSQIGLPTGTPVTLFLVFEETAFLAQGQSKSSIEIAMDPMRGPEAWRLDVAYTSAGYQHDLRRVR